MRPCFVGNMPARCPPTLYVCRLFPKLRPSGAGRQGGLLRSGRHETPQQLQQADTSRERTNTTNLYHASTHTLELVRAPIGKNPRARTLLSFLSSSLCPTNLSRRVRWARRLRVKLEKRTFDAWVRDEENSTKKESYGWISTGGGPSRGRSSRSNTPPVPNLPGELAFDR